ncbi:MAG TPA: UDP-N-acetylmuramyl-tripeptide synthetase [Candidatus Kapabacteria bacterium]|nr:UDP-N-acetylmuramyl-tripeptide synthetase [Candidatus Kapabacteria bacterium]
MIKKILPKSIKNRLHYLFAWIGAVQYRHPSEELLVIGVTGTSGKSSTVYWLRTILEQGGFTVGSLSTIDFYIAGKNKLNDQKMTMLGRKQIQQYLREMVSAGCEIAILEMTSEGAVQHRNKFINVDIMALTNFYPEHIESHGNFENYKQAKLSLFRYAAKTKRKALRIPKLESLQIITPGRTMKAAVVNGDNEYAHEFLESGAFDCTICFGKADTNVARIRDVTTTPQGISFRVLDTEFHPRIYGEYNAYNIACVISIARIVGVPIEVIQSGVNSLHGAPGRVEFIPEAEEKGFRVIVDYAFEPIALQGLYDVVKLLAPKRIIHVLGGTGGGRDTSRRGIMGKMVGENASIVIVTNEDPYDEDPRAIMAMVRKGAEDAGKKLGETLFDVLDRKEAIRLALQKATPGDMVLITGKGSEQAMCVANGKKIPWDDRVVVKACLQE